MKKYTKEHQWIELKADGTAKIGITRYAADELGEVTYVELPAVGKTVQGNDTLCAVESVKAASDVFMPATGTVVEVNAPLDKDPSPINDDPEGAGWICLVKDVDAATVAELMDETQYAEFCK